MKSKVSRRSLFPLIGSALGLATAAPLLRSELASPLSEAASEPELEWINVEVGTDQEVWDFATADSQAWTSEELAILAARGPIITLYGEVA